jgi:hypothetical protein
MTSQKILQDMLQRHKCKPLTKKQLSVLLYFIDQALSERETDAFRRGVEAEKLKFKEHLRADRNTLLMTFQRLGDANAQMTLAFERILKGLPT